ncbi:MAG: UDP-glucose/GDP-mannose dehydrogenase family protein [Planctomycetes bacterium]|nr:UDP-glucose/GDP-mannose dehydrogenase family protein [Planctomycetota bacterium]MBU1518328.1 UDP-glucose/GDP-mannose dehydrogenase family protein [Planctomycetota bacterium]MBU2458579.1 UDP-glucose/GDP-mannose dehydrogenase family protein [Planctomycetota bacterium]MBU2596049.1 UDP-glucose/GDP-mannose dehydrogenase family protein [Planctomycetota bacterium]
MKLTVVGVGYVGLVAAGGLAESGNHIICVDNDENKIDNLKKGNIPIYEPGLADIIKNNERAGRLSFTTDLKYAVNNSKVIIIGVGTPSAPDGSADISAVLAVCEKIAEYMKEHKIIVTKSTVPIGTHKIVADLIKSKTNVPFDYVSNPEFLKEGSAVDDFAKPDRVIIGTDNAEVQETMKQLYSPFMRKGSRIIFMDAASAETAKYAANVMLATRISFMNELSGLCERYGADIEKVRAGIGSDPRIGNSFLFAGAGYGGSCFPKDVKAMIYMGRQMACPQTIAEAVQQANYSQHDRFANKVLSYFKGRENKTTLAVWGLAFKAKTDDVRESPAIWCINKFLKAGIKVKAFDPEAMETAKSALKQSIEMSQNDYQAIDGADALVIFTDWQQFRMPDFDLIKDKLKKPVIFDGRNLYEPTYVKKLGFEYYCVGRA